uniref:hypothetical protein n=1 Tax=Acetatifactor sp. TaxID=1872090 RepID=UPI0040559F20
MSIHTSSQETINTLIAIFEKHKNARVCVLGTTCCGKSTLLKQIPGCVDLDDELWPQLTKEEAEYISQTPWTKEIGDTVDRLVYERIHVKQGHPLFTTIIVDCDAVIYLDISDELLAEHCEKRNVTFIDAKNMKEAIENDWNHHKSQGIKKFYYLMVTE